MRPSTSYANACWWACVFFCLVWLVLSFFGDTAACITRSTVFAAASFVIGALQ